MQERVRGILIENNKIILIKRVKSHEAYYCFPGGGVEVGENNIEALVREMKEELGLEVRVKHLLVEKKFIRDNGEQMEYFYICEKNSGELGTGDGREFQPGNNYDGTHEIAEVPLIELTGLRLLPEEVKEKVISVYVK